MKRLGIDIGSLYLGAVVIEGNLLVATNYQPHKGNIKVELQKLLDQRSYQNYDVVGVTGLRAGTIDNTLAVIEGARFLLPGCRNVFAIGGETFSLLCFDERGAYREHSLNPPCASGTGSFIEQQAERLNISVADLAERACRYKGKTPVIATRCAVFAKTDIIHAMQEGYSLDAVCAGLCEGIARNILDVLRKGRELLPPIGVVGGVSCNEKIMSTLGQLLGKAVVRPQYAEVAGAIGAAMLASAPTLDAKTFVTAVHTDKNVRPVLQIKLSHYPDWASFNIYQVGAVEVFLPKERLSVADGVYLGIDIGSTSTKAVLLNKGNEIVGGVYTTTGGKPIDAVEKLLDTIRSTWKEPLRLLGTGTTGSGRKMIKELFNADKQMDEITAHARAALYLMPQADTIIEIGGQDSKFTRIRGGEVYYANMNYVCAAGTGSFIEEQAKRLGVNLQEFSELALRGQAPYTSDRCTVYMERDLSELLSAGWSKEALAAAVLYSVRDNYLAKVINRSAIGDYVVFQGATARNNALVAAFEELLQKPIHVSPYCHLTGALGAALLCRESGLTQSQFIWKTEKIQIEKEICQQCTNYCVLTVTRQDQRKTGWGMKCGRDYASTTVKKVTVCAPERRFREIMAPMLQVPQVESPRRAITIGIPYGLYHMEYLPLWYNLLSQLGFTISIPQFSRKALTEGKAIVNADFCAPMVLGHGYMQMLLEDGAQYIFAPAVVNEKSPDAESELFFRKKTRDSYFCYYSQYLPSLMSTLTSSAVGGKLISPLIFFQEQTSAVIAREICQELNKFFPDVRVEEVEKAFANSWEKFAQARSNWRRVYEKLTPPNANGNQVRVVLLGRPYVVFDPALNLNIPQKLEELGAELFWQEEFDLDNYTLTYSNRFYERMHWHYGKRIIQVAEYCARTDNLFAVYLTSFRCSPDSFLISYVKDIMTHYDKPFLVMQLDEHGSDVGYTTRIEAGLRSFSNYRIGKKPKPADDVVTRAKNDAFSKGDTVLIPYIDSLISRFWADCFTRAGCQAILLEPDEKALSTGYLYASGGECMPLVAIVGSAVEKLKNAQITPHQVFFYMPTVCMACNFPQFPIFADLAFRSAGFPGIKIALINTMTPGDVLPAMVAIKIFESYMVGCIMYKMYNRIKPYEVKKGETDKVFAQARQSIHEAILAGKNLQAALTEVAALFRGIARDENNGRKPRIGLLGDLYVKFNELVNQRIQKVVEDLGGELIVPSMTEYPLHFYDADRRLYGDDAKHYQALHNIESRYERVAADIIGEQLEPDFAECVELMKAYKVKHYLPGETSINVGRALYYINKKNVEAIVHVNPMFCCPGVVTASIYRKIQEDFQIPIIDIFYDGTGKPNKVLIPHLYYLKNKKR